MQLILQIKPCASAKRVPPVLAELLPCTCPGCLPQGSKAARRAGLAGLGGDHWAARPAQGSQNRRVPDSEREHLVGEPRRSPAHPAAEDTEPGEEGICPGSHAELKAKVSESLLKYRLLALVSGSQASVKREGIDPRQHEALLQEKKRGGTKTTRRTSGSAATLGPRAQGRPEGFPTAASGRSVQTPNPQGKAQFTACHKCWGMQGSLGQREGTAWRGRKGIEKARLAATRG